MPSRISRLFSRFPKGKKSAEEMSLEGDGQFSGLPPGYHRDNNISPPDSAAGFRKLRVDEDSSTGVPTPTQCTAHLKVLECFYRLRERVGSTSGLFGINDDLVLGSDNRNEEQTAARLSRLADKRWAIFVAQAVDRYEAWLESILPDTEMITIERLLNIRRDGILSEPNLPFLKLDGDHLPPVDVLMVWHAHCLNPRAYLEHCRRYGRMKLWHAPFPWQAMADMIDSDTFEYGHNDPLEHLTPQKTVPCLQCRAKLSVPWTTCTAFAHDSVPDEASSDHSISAGSGYCDAEFATTCGNTQCRAKLNHDRFRAARLCEDFNSLIYSNIPMAGTLLSNLGLPRQAIDGISPNGVLQRELGPHLQDLFEGNIPKAIHAAGTTIDSKSRQQSPLSTQGYDSRPDELLRTGFRKMMNRYSDTSSPFALDLTGAVLRQGSFIEKMHHIDWLHSPALNSTTTRLIEQYRRFVAIMADPSSMAVPTLAIDLAWHTHQLHPSSYLQYTVKATGQFIDHDDKIGEGTLNDALAWTSKMYEERYGEPYSECGCWYCEALREGQRGGDRTSTANDRSAVLATIYLQACERAARNRRLAPRREDYYYSEAWDCPVYIPAYGPHTGFVPYKS